MMKSSDTKPTGKISNQMKMAISRNSMCSVTLEKELQQLLTRKKVVEDDLRKRKEKFLHKQKSNSKLFSTANYKTKDFLSPGTEADQRLRSLSDGCNTAHYINDIEERGELRRWQTIGQLEIQDKILSKLKQNDLPSENSFSNDQSNKTDKKLSSWLPLLPSSHVRCPDSLKKDSSKPWTLRIGKTEALKAIVQKSCTSASTSHTTTPFQAEKEADHSNQNRIGTIKPLDHDALKKESCLKSKHPLILPPVTPERTSDQDSQE